MNIPAAIRNIQEAMVEAKSWPYINAYLQSALAALQPPRYVLHEDDNIFICDTQHPEYRKTETLAGYDQWVVLFWIGPGPIERQKARAIVEHLNSTATHETTT